jgi:hypothetical protein
VGSALAGFRLPWAPDTSGGVGHSRASGPTWSS